MKKLVILAGGLATLALMAIACSGSSTPSTTTPRGAPGAATAVPTENSPPGDIPDNQVFVNYTSAGGGYLLDTPEGWARTESGQNAKFTDKLHTISVELSSASSAPTVESVTANELPALATQAEAFQKERVEAASLPSGTAIHVRYLVNATPDSVTGKQVRLEVDRYEYFKNGKLATLSLSAPAGSDNLDVWNQISSSFAWK